MTTGSTDAMVVAIVRDVNRPRSAEYLAGAGMHNPTRDLPWFIRFDLEGRSVYVPRIERPRNGMIAFAGRCPKVRQRHAGYLLFMHEAREGHWADFEVRDGVQLLGYGEGQAGSMALVMTGYGT